MSEPLNQIVTIVAAVVESRGYERDASWLRVAKEPVPGQRPKVACSWHRPGGGYYASVDTDGRISLAWIRIWEPGVDWREHVQIHSEYIPLEDLGDVVGDLIDTHDEEEDRRV